MIRYKRRVEIMVREAKAKIAAADYKAARNKIKGLLDELHNAPVHAYDAQLEGTGGTDAPNCAHAQTATSAR